MNHKRKRPKNRRGGCLLCKPHKANGSKNRETAAVYRKSQDDIQQILAEYDPNGDEAERALLDYDFKCRELENGGNG